MKNLKLTIAVGMLAALTTACNNNKDQNADSDSTMVVTETENSSSTQAQVQPGSYVNLSTGEEVYVIPDPVTGIAIDSVTQLPVQFYYNPTTMDTLYQTGLRVNSMLIKEGEGKYRLDDTKIKIDGDEIKIKTDSTKLKVDGDDMKMKSPEGKTKIDDGEMKVKPNN